MANEDENAIQDANPGAPIERTVQQRSTEFSIRDAQAAEFGRARTGEWAVHMFTAKTRDWAMAFWMFDVLLT